MIKFTWLSLILLILLILEIILNLVIKFLCINKKYFLNKFSIFKKIDLENLKEDLKIYQNQMTSLNKIFIYFVYNHY